MKLFTTPKSVILAVTAITALSWCIYAFADNKSPIRINADQVTIDEIRQTSTYTGNVSLQRDNLRLNADQLQVYTSNKKLQRTVATGKPVKFKQNKPEGGKILANASEMEYEAQSGILWLRKNALIIDDENRISGEQIQYDTVKREILASTPGTNSGQVEIILDSDSVTNE